MTPLGEILRGEIAGRGPIPFRRFMEAALYHPELGYYRRERDPFGKHGDFYTAEQLQPVFGILIGERVRRLYEELGRPGDFTVVELGAGRGEMRSAFEEFRYVPVEVGCGALPDGFAGVAFSNEFFDALPAAAAIRRGEEYRELFVDWDGGQFTWTDGPRADAGMEEYIARYLSPREEGEIVEVNFEALRWIDDIAERLERGFAFTIDYGYTKRESARFPQGTLMSYRRHAALEDVLAEPGERDITAHVCFTALEERGAAAGLECVRQETLARTLLSAGEADQFAAALQAGSEAERAKRTLQLKTLLFGMGETFRTLLQRKREGTARAK